jgi:hypothetical protein
LATYDSSLCSCRALVYAIGETLWRAGGRKKATVAMLDIPAIYIDRNLKEEDQDEVSRAFQMCTCIWPLCKAFELIERLIQGVQVVFLLAVLHQL